MRPLAFVLLLLSIVLPSFGQAPNADPVGRDRDPSTTEKLWELIAKGKYQAVLESLDDSAEPSDHLFRAIAYNGLEEYDLATSEGWMALGDPGADERDIAEAHNQVGLALARPALRDFHRSNDVFGALQALEQAEDHFRKAYQLGGEDRDGALLNLACALIAQSLLDYYFDRRAEIEILLHEVAADVPAFREWARESLEGRPAMPDGFGGAAQIDRTGNEPTLASSAEVSSPDKSDGPVPVVHPAQAYLPMPTEHEGQRIYLAIGDGVTKPEKLRAPQPQFTESARRDRVQGVVIVQAIITAAGTVANPVILQSLDPRLDRQVIAAVSKWLFEPARLNGEPVPIYYNMTVNFRLQ